MNWEQVSLKIRISDTNAMQVNTYDSVVYCYIHLSILFKSKKYK